MGIVYLARDTRLPRDVAIKVLHPGTCTDQKAREEFRKEAEVLAMMTHTNIATILDFDDTHPSGDYIVMEYVPGETLSDIVARGPMSESQVVTFGAQLLDGLASAHAKHLVHRDLKPGNLRITPDGVLKILDFGVARLWGQEAEVPDPVVTPLVRRGRTLFMTRSFAGTYPYISPEQLKGVPLDERADLYAAGAVIYEMATGAEIFRAIPEAELADAIEQRSPLAPRKLQRTISRPLQTVIQRALAKQPGQRFATAPAMRAALLRTRWLRLRVATITAAALLLLGIGFGLDIGGTRHRLFPGFATGEVRTLFLPQFENATGDATYDDLCAGLTRDVIEALNRTRTVRAIAPATALRCAARGRAADVFANQRGAQAVVQGSLRMIAGRLQLTAELREPGSWRAVHRATWDVKPQTLAKLEADVVALVRSRLQLPDAGIDLPTPTESPAWSLYHRECAWLGRPEADAWKQASDFFEAAIHTDSTFAPAYAARALAAFAAPSDALPILVGMSRTWEEGVRALALDPGLPAAYLALAIVHGIRDENWDEAMQNLSRGLELDPANAATHRFLGYAMLRTQRFTEAAAEFQRAWELDPLNPVTCDTLWSRFATGQFDSVVALARRTLLARGDDWEVHLILGQALGQLEPNDSSLHQELAHQVLRFLVPRDLFWERRSTYPSTHGDQIASSVAPGTIYVSDVSAFGGKGGVIAFDPETGRQTKIASGEYLSACIALDVLRDGSLLVCNQASSSLVRLDPRIGQQTMVSKGQLLVTPCGIWIESPEAALVADWNLWDPSRVIRVDLATGNQTAIRIDSSIVNAIGVVATSSGRLLVSDCTASANGGAILEVEASGDCRVLARNGYLAGPMCMALGPDGFVYAADFNAFAGSGGVIRVDPATGAQSIVSRGGAFEDPVGIVFLPDGDLLVADWSEFGVDGRLVRVDPRTGEQKRVYEGGMFVRPTGVAIVPGAEVPRSRALVVEGPMRIRGGAFDSVSLLQSATLTVDGRLEVRGDLRVAGGARLVGSGRIRIAGDVRIESGGVVSHAPGHLAGLELDIGGRLEIQAAGRIDVTGCGLRGGTIGSSWRGESFDAAGRVLLGSPGRATKGSGGSHGGLGARDGDGGMPGPTYGEANDPRFLGAGGGGSGGGNGGGRVTVRAQRIIVDGIVSANGAPGVLFLQDAGGGGAGGSVRLEAREITGAGRIEASGGGAGCTFGCSGAGGGGRILMTCATSTLPSDHVIASSGNARFRGAAGTVRWRVAGVTSMTGGDRGNVERSAQR